MRPKFTLPIVVLALALPAAPALAQEAQYVLRIDGITCPFCVATSEKALKKIKGVSAVSANLDEGTITLCADESKADISDATLAKLFKGKGFTYRGKAKRGSCPA